MSRAETARIVGVTIFVSALIALAGAMVAIVKTGVVYHIEDSLEITYANPISP